ncbi:Saccharopine dehydrogenase-like oxidoreductase [Halotydeus destructor]|nr:Saccharopine dehydrogenase-like oxidoreductase [Halotydeus destructor]
MESSLEADFSMVRLEDAEEIKRLDIIIFGASGYTGQYCIESLVKTIDKENSGLTFGVAGRSAEKLKQSLSTVSGWLNRTLENVPIIVADVSDEQSVLAMCHRSQIVINAVGPYALFGEVVVKSCIAAKTHHVDLAGEPHFLEGMQLKYHDEAKEAGVLIVGACGFDSIPAELGVDLLRENFDGELAFVNYYFKINTLWQGGSMLNHGTYDSFLHGVAHWRELKQIRSALYKKAFKTEFPSYKFQNELKLLPHTPEDIGSLTIPFWPFDKYVSARTQMHNYVEHNQRPIQLNAYNVIGSWLAVIGLVLLVPMIVLLSQFEWSRKFLSNYPHIISLGMISKNGPTREQVKSTSFQMTLIGRGWPGRLSSPTDELSGPPSEKIIGKVTGPEPAYDAASTMIVQAAITILKERDSINFEGGVLTPGLVFPKTTLRERLARYNVKFELVN